METKIQKWGNSLALRIPKIYAKNTKIEQDTLVDISIEDGKLIIVPIVEPVDSLNSLLAQITEENIHGEIDTGHSVGKEIW